jgi:SAM-dependent methyltransferase
MNSVCRICNNGAGNRLHTAREIAFGLREHFTYLECGQCGCVQLVDIPSDIGKYYPPGYYSLRPQGALATFVRRRWSAHAYGRKNLVGWLFTELFFSHRSMLAIRRVAPPKAARILDVGCGRGNLLQDLAWLGFSNLTGADPFIERDLTYETGVKIFKRELGELAGQFDLIALNHSFEHMPHPAEVMRQIAERLAPNGKVILGIPVADSYAWKRYGVNWSNMDPPRHLFLHTRRSIEFLAAKAGLVIESVFYEGNDEQFWLSEQYSRDIPSTDPRSVASTPLKRLLAWNKIRVCRVKAEELNRKQEGDMICFHIRAQGASNF